MDTFSNSTVGLGYWSYNSTAGLQFNGVQLARLQYSYHTLLQRSRSLGFRTIFNRLGKRLSVCHELCFSVLSRFQPPLIRLSKVVHY
jgi:hypothetical protein